MSLCMDFLLSPSNQVMMKAQVLLVKQYEHLKIYVLNCTQYYALEYAFSTCKDITSQHIKKRSKAMGWSSCADLQTPRSKW